MMRQKAGELGRHLDHQHAGKQRPARDVPPRPPRVGPDIVIAGEQLPRLVDQHDRIEQRELVPLRVVRLDLLARHDGMVQIQRRRIQKHRRRHRQTVS